LREHVPSIQATGARLVVVGNGQPWQAQAFLDDHPVDAELLVDPKLEAYAAAGLRRSMASTMLNVKSLKHGRRAMKAGHRQGKIQGDPWQQGGAFIISPDHQVHFAQVSGEAGDHVDPMAILRALEDLAP
jgi:peroxiredoxin